MLVYCEKCGETTERQQRAHPCHPCVRGYLEYCLVKEIGEATGWTIQVVRRWLNVFGLKARVPARVRNGEPREVRDVTAKEAQMLLFYTIVRTVRDFLMPIQIPLRPRWAKKIAVHWILDLVPLSYGDDEMIITFPEALEMIGIAPENTGLIRQAVLDARDRDPSEWLDIGQRCWLELSFHDNEPLPLWAHEKSYIPRAIIMDDM